MKPILITLLLTLSVSCLPLNATSLSEERIEVFNEGFDKLHEGETVRQLIWFD